MVFMPVYGLRANVPFFLGTSKSFCTFGASNQHLAWNISPAFKIQPSNASFSYPNQGNAGNKVYSYWKAPESWDWHWMQATNPPPSTCVPRCMLTANTPT